MKREDYINWDEYFMGIALLTAMRSKDPNSQVGACIVSPENKILSLGYNGMPMGCSDDEMPWEREGAPLQTKYMYVCHAELNAILNSAHNNLKGARVYVTLFPCNECTKAIIQSGIAEVVYYGDKYHCAPDVRLIQAFHGLVKSEPLIGFGQFWVHDSCFPPGVVGDQHFQQPFLADDSHATTSFNHIVVLIFIFVNYY